MLCLTLLTACSSPQIVRTEYIYQQIPPLPEAPVMYPVQWQRAGALYALDERNAKALLKNWELQRGYAAELRAILEALKREEK
jgi:DNA gyrase/topoisomerase IV subunit B